MEEENVQVNNGAKKFDLKGFDYKKYLPIAGIALAVVVVLIILVSLLGGGPKKAVKKYISGMNRGNAKKMYTYNANHYVIGKNLIITQDDVDGGCDSALVYHIIENYILPYFKI